MILDWIELERIGLDDHDENKYIIDNPISSFGLRRVSRDNILISLSNFMSWMSMVAFVVGYFRTFLFLLPNVMKYIYHSHN